MPSYSGDSSSSSSIAVALIADEYQPRRSLRAAGLKIVAADPLLDDPRMKRRLSLAYCACMLCVGL
jgi:hypothetical protein